MCASLGTFYFPIFMHLASYCNIPEYVDFYLFDIQNGLTIHCKECWYLMQLNLVIQIKRKT